MFSAIRTRIRPESVSTRLTLWYLLTLGASLAVFVALVYGVRVVRARTAPQARLADGKQPASRQFLR